MDPLSRVCLAVSSFKHDEAVLSLLDGCREHLSRFARVLVVDSLGTGNFRSLLEQRGLTSLVEYQCFPQNLGSAGNFAKRLELAAEGNAEFVYALNHDGHLAPRAIARLVELAETAPTPLGAIYPLRRMTGRGGDFDVTGRFRFPFVAVRSRTPPERPLTDVYWSSSNGALFSLAPIRQGLLPFAALWMGYEDLAFGWLLAAHGYRQFLTPEVRVEDNYEYRRTAVGQVTDKPPWYAYYHARNLLLATRLTAQPMPIQALAVTRALLELGVTVAVRANKRARLRATAQGLFDGLRGRSGKWRLP